jgi:hypothetical protein
MPLDQYSAGSLGFPSKMPGTSYGIPASACKTGAVLASQPGTTCSNCYAKRGNYVFPSVVSGQATRLAALDDLPRWVAALTRLLRKAHGLDGSRPHPRVSDLGYHRWHDSGDLQSVEHLAAICAVAAATPEIRHWLPTREARTVATYRRNGGAVPDNLTIRLSATMVDSAAPRAWPVTSTVHAATTPRGHVCPAPTQGNQCGDCRACWSQAVANVSYHQH